MDLALYCLLEQLQDRDITPEDYDVLLELHTVDNAPRTMAAAAVERFPSFRVGGAGAGCCVVCLAELGPGQEARRLPCGHEFHRACIDDWLTQGADGCPMKDWSFGDGGGC